MKKFLTIGLAVMAVMATRAMAGAHEVLPASEILATVRSMGLGPVGVARRRGPFYVLHAYDAHGLELRVVADAQFGDILSVTPAREFIDFYVPVYIRGPRIIHVPQRDDASATDDDEDLARPHGHVIPRHRSEAPLPNSTRNALRASPSLFDGPTPIRPIPRFKVKADGDAGNGSEIPPPGGN